MSLQTFYLSLLRVLHCEYNRCGFCKMVLRYISVWLYGSGQAGIIPDAVSVVATRLCTVATSRQTRIRHISYLWSSTKDTVYANIVETRETLETHTGRCKRDPVPYLGLHTRPNLVPTSFWLMYLCPRNKLRAFTTRKSSLS